MNKSLHKPFHQPAVKIFLASLAFIFLISGNVLAQVSLHGKVTDAKTKEALPFASIFINNTTIGTLADKNGDYTLKIPTGYSEVIFTFLGYHSKRARVTLITAGELALDMKLVEVDQTLQDITVKGTRDKEWEKSFKIFKRVLLGETAMSPEAKILNAGYIDFEKTKDAGKWVLTAKASQPIEIENGALGYKISYDLKGFRATSDYYKFNGFVHFKPMNPKDAGEAKRWEENRLTVYNGSMRHFLKSILDRRLTQEGFETFVYRKGLEKARMRSTLFSDKLNDMLTPYNPSDFVTTDTIHSGYRISFENKIEVHYLKSNTPGKNYRDVFVPVTELEIKGEYADVSPEGILLNPDVLTAGGAMSEGRIADLLPYDYSPGAPRDFILKDPARDKSIALRRIQEKVYFQTDKSYYYPGDAVWFKGYFNYTSPGLYDTLSHVIYVDLIGPDFKLVQTTILPIDSGKVVGDFILPDRMAPGNYLMRAYTNWMRNYSDRDFFYKQIPVLDALENMSVQAVPLDSARKMKFQVEVIPDRETYHPKDPIVLRIKLNDDFDNPVPAELSMSVTDVEEVIQLPHERNIQELFTKDKVHQLAAGKEQFPIEYGISLEGHFQNDRGKAKQTQLSVIQGEMENMVTIDTDDEGKFRASGFDFKDSVEFGFAARTVKGIKQYGKVVLKPKDPPPVMDSLVVINFPHRSMEIRREKAEAFDLKNRIVLKEVTVKAVKIDDARPSSSPFSTADRVFTGEKLLSVSSDIVLAIAELMPGARYKDNTSLFITPATSMNGYQEPLLIVDGLTYIPDAMQTVATMINRIPTSTILRVEIFKYGGSAAYGARAAAGVIVITTTHGQKPSDQPLGYDKTQVQLLTVRGLSTPDVFKSPQYDDPAKKDLQPDNRTTIFWNPSVTIDPKTGEAKVSFYAAERTTTYRVIIEGVTLFGDPVHTEYFVKVSK
jgi:CarboxypepD_reg-like domain/TonB-dependent Receptor Plug Domain